MVELYYKKQSEEKHEVELNKGLSDRLFKILFNYSITPGVDWNGVFNKKEFKKWMDYVKEWSEANDRYAVTVHFVDVEGKPERELAGDYKERAQIVESKGYARYADVLRDISSEYAREAERNIESSKRNGLE